MLLISMISIVIDISEKIHKYIDAELSTLEIITGYYVAFIPWINGLMWPLFSLIAVIFFTSRLARNTEIVAMLSAGMSFRRILLPYALASSVLAAAFWVGKNYVIPYSNKKKNDFEIEHLSKRSIKTLNTEIHFFLNENEKVYIRYYKKRDTTAQGFRLETFEDGRLVKTIQSEKLIFKAEPNEWTIKDYKIRTFKDMDETLVIAKGMSIDTVLNLTPSDFVQNLKIMENMTTGDLEDYVARQTEKGVAVPKNFIIQLHQRNSEPFSIIILTIIGVAVASRKIRGGMGLHLALGVIIGAAFVVISQFSATFSNNLSMSPAWGAWIPNILFGLIAWVLVLKSQK